MTIPALLALLDELREKIEAIQEEVGRMQVENELYPANPAFTNVVAPTAPDLEIMGGEVTEGFPDCCALGSDTLFCCTGTLIAPTIVVTADHCRGITRAFFGKNVATPDSGEMVRVIQQHAHPELDLRVLVLESPAKALPCRVARTAEIGGPTFGTVVGFGTIDHAGEVGYGIKRMARVPIQTLDGSEPGAQKRFGCVPGREMVAGQRGLAVDTCRGDSGGPLYISTRDGALALLGATSRGTREGFARCGDGGVYVRVDLCLDWMWEVTGVPTRG